SQSALRATSAACSGWAETEGMRSHSARSSRKAPRWASMYVRTVLTTSSTGLLMFTSLAAHGGVFVRRFSGGPVREGRGVLGEQPLQCRTVQEPAGADDLAAADVHERGCDGFQGHALPLGPGEAVHGELERVRGPLAAGLPVDDLVRRPVAVAVLVD